MRLHEIDALKPKLDALPLPPEAVRNLHRLVLKEIDNANDAAHIDADMAPRTNLVTECLCDAFDHYWFVLAV